MNVVLTIAGSDSGGHAGLQADLRTFARLGVHGATVVTCLTAQNRRAVAKIEPCSPRMLRAQWEAVFAESPPAAAKTGMLYSAGIVREVARFFRRERIPLVVDPVMAATSGRRLLQRDAVTALRRELLPLATVVTPNVMEAEALTGRKIREPEDLRDAARKLHSLFGCAVLAKGGHLPGTREAVDFLFDGKREWMLSAPRTRGATLRGTGCIYSAAIAAGLARGMRLLEAVGFGKEVVTGELIGDNRRKSLLQKPWDRRRSERLLSSREEHHSHHPRKLSRGLE